MLSATTLTLLLTAFAGQPTEGLDARPSTAPTHRWAVEVELIQPFLPEVGIISIRGSRTLWGESGGVRGDLLLGAFIRPNVKHDVVETIDEYLLAVGYRQYIWRGLHAEVALLGGWVWGQNNKLDGEDYSNPTLLGEALVGYRFGFWEPGGFYADGSTTGVYVSPQFGVIQGLVTDIGPRGGKSDTFLQAKLLVGVSF